MFITAVCVIFLIKLRWPKNKSLSDVLILWRFIHVCGKFHTDTINQTVFGKEFVNLVWGKWKLFRASLNYKTAN